MLRLGDLPGLYREVGREEAIAIAELGVQVYQAAQDRLMGIWAAQQSAEEGTRAEGWKAQGAAAALESLKGRLAAGDAAAARVAALQAGVDAEVDRRLADALASAHKDAELAKMKELGALREQIASESGKGEYVKMLKEAHAVMRERIAALEAQVAAQATKSSQAIGKAGEATVLDILENTVCKMFTHSAVKDMTTVPHAADFHLWVMGATGQKIKILIDSKKYKRAVNSDEISKLCTDMDADDECHCGIMISISSGISTKNQFGISRTEKQKPVLFLTFADLSTESQKDILCWGVQVMSELVGTVDDGARQKMMNNLEEFLDSILLSVKDLDVAIREQLKSIEFLKEARGKMLKSVGKFRGDVDDICTAIVKKTGVRCENKVVEGGVCGNHRPKEMVKS
jgi:hypothetical protein